MADTSAERNAVDWFNLIRHLLGAGFVIFGCFSLLYSHISMYNLLWRYKTTGQAVSGKILSCADGRSNAERSIEVLYTVVAPAKRQYPNLDVKPRQYVLKAYTQSDPLEGSMIDLLVLPGIPKSACTVEMIDTLIARHSHGITALILVPALTLMGAFLFVSHREIKKFDGLSQEIMAWSLLIVWILFCSWFSYIFCHGRFRFQRRIAFLRGKDANARWKMGRSSTSLLPIRQEDGKSDPLLSTDDTIPIFCTMIDHKQTDVTEDYSL